MFDHLGSFTEGSMDIKVSSCIRVERIGEELAWVGDVFVVAGIWTIQFTKWLIVEFPRSQFG